MASNIRNIETAYVGLDVSLEETSICILDDDGRIIWEGSVPSEPEAIRDAISAVAIHPQR